MSTSPLALEDLEARYQSMSGLLKAFGPEWLSPLRERALNRYREFGWPTSHDEEYRSISFNDLRSKKLEPAYGATVNREDLADYPLGTHPGLTLTFVNGQYAPDLSNEEQIPEGLVFCPLEEAFANHEGVSKKWLTQVATLSGKLGSTNDERFVDLNTAFLSEGAFIHVAKGVTVTDTVQLRFVSTADHGAIAIHPRVLIVLEENAELSVAESYIGLEGEYFNNPVTEIVVGKAARLEHTRVQLESETGDHVATTAIHQSADSVLNSTVVNFGSRLCRHDLNVWLDGEHTETWLNGASLGLNHQVIDNHTRIDHAKPNCNSFEVYKTILGDHAAGVFNGKIFVYEDAQKTDAKQTNQALLLSPTAKIDTKPQLEIFADDVKCTHGATVGQLREDALFYLRARGIGIDEAKALLVYAFACEVLEKIHHQELKDALETRLFDKLALRASELANQA